jgi:hypothetical protein
MKDFSNKTAIFISFVGKKNCRNIHSVNENRKKGAFIPTKIHFSLDLTEFFQFLYFTTK